MGASLDALDNSTGLKDACLELQKAVSDAGGIPTITSTLRTRAEQQFLWDRYQRGLSSLPAAPPGHSAHEWGWAFDMVVSPEQWQPSVGRLWAKWGGAYGGRRDPVHFELKGAGKLAYALGEQGYDPSGQAGQATPQTQTEIWALPKRWRTILYAGEDFGLSFVPGVNYVILIAGLLKSGYPDSQILTLLSQPVETLHEWFPNIPF